MFLFLILSCNEPSPSLVPPKATTPFPSRIYAEHKLSKRAHNIDFQRLCDTHYLEACIELGERYAIGDGGVKDVHTSFTLFQKACSGGNLKGCHRKAMCYYYGDGVARDYEILQSLLQSNCEAGYTRSCSALNDLSKIQLEEVVDDIAEKVGL